MTYLLAIPYAAIAILVMAYLVYKCKTITGKVVVGIITIFAAFLPLGWDAMLGSVYFNYLCSEKGGIHVYHTIKLGGEYFDEHGIPKFYDDKKTFKEMNIANRYIGEGKFDRNYSRRLNIAKQQYKIIDSKTGSVLGDFITYMYFGGWFVKHSGFHGAGETCNPIRETDKQLRQLPTKVFYKN